jgi:phospholipid/cholesterol/gamma-HCH transport system substrate-binding protein
MSSYQTPERNLGEVIAGAVVLAVAAAFFSYGVANTGHEKGKGIRLSAEFDNIGTLASGADVRIAGVKVGSILHTGYDPQTYRARVDFTVAKDVRLPSDSSAQIASAGLLGSASLNLVPGGGDTMLTNGQQMQITQSAANLEDLLGKFIFNVGSLADASQKRLQHDAAENGNKNGAKAP